MKPKSRNIKELQKKIANCLKKGLPLAGLISAVISATGCDRLFPRVAGKFPAHEEQENDGQTQQNNEKEQTPPLAGDIIVPQEPANDEKPTPKSNECPEPEENEAKHPLLPGVPPQSK